MAATGRTSGSGYPALALRSIAGIILGWRGVWKAVEPYFVDDADEDADLLEVEGNGDKLKAAQQPNEFWTRIAECFSMTHAAETSGSPTARSANPQRSTVSLGDGPKGTGDRTC